MVTSEALRPPNEDPRDPPSDVCPVLLPEVMGENIRAGKASANVSRRATSLRKLSAQSRRVRAVLRAGPDSFRCNWLNRKSLRCAKAPHPNPLPEYGARG